MEYCLVEEVHFTDMCRAEFSHFYSNKASNRGSLFDWPGGNAVEICPGTGKKVSTSPTKRRLLVASRMCGWIARPDGQICMLTRVIPRILTLEGCEKMLGHTPRGSPNRLTQVSGPGAKKGSSVLQEVYPDLLRRMAGLKPGKQRKRLPAAQRAWEAFHDTGHYLAYEKLRP